MNMLLLSSLIPLMAFLHYWAGGNIFPLPKKFSWLPEATMGLIIAGAVSFHYGNWWIFAPVAVFSFFMINLGHGTIYKMTGWQSSDPNRKQTLECVVRFFYRGDIHKPLYSWLCMGFKGLLIGLPLFPYGLSLAFLWPLAYYLGNVQLGHNKYAELISGAILGVVIALVV